MAVSQTFVDLLRRNLQKNFAMPLYKTAIQPNDEVWVWMRPNTNSASLCFVSMSLAGNNQWKVNNPQTNGWAALASFIEAAANDTGR